MPGEPPNPGYTPGTPWLDFNIDLCPGQLFRSESGIYTGLLKDNGEFIVARGDPTVAANQAWTTASPRSGADQFFFVTKNGVAEIITYDGRSSYTYNWYSDRQRSGPKDNYFLNLSDAGTLAIKFGTPANPGSQVWSNGVNDPLDVNGGGVTIENIVYDFQHVKSEPPTEENGAALDCINQTPTQQTCVLTLTLTYTKTHTFTFTANQSIQIGYKSSVKVGAPGLGEGSAEWSVTGTVGFSEGYSDADTQTKTFTATVTITVPPHSTYKAQLVGLRVNATIPYVYTGVAKYKSGKTARLVNVPATYSGVDTGQFSAQISCVVTPGGCSPGVLRRLPVVKTARGYFASSAFTR